MQMDRIIILCFSALVYMAQLYVVSSKPIVRGALPGEVMVILLSSEGYCLLLSGAIRSNYYFWLGLW